MTPASRKLTGLISIPSDGAMDWIAPNWPVPADMAGSRITATRLTPGAISLSNSNHFVLRLYSNIMKPVALPPGRRQAVDEAGADRVDDARKDDRHGSDDL